MKIIFVKELNICFGLLLAVILLLSSCNNKNVTENYGLVTNQEVYDIKDLQNDERLVFTTGFVRDDIGVTYIDNSYLRVSSKCIKKIDGVAYVFDDDGYLAKNKIVEGISYPMSYPINDPYPRLADENGVLITYTGVYNINNEIYFVYDNGRVAEPVGYVLYDGKFYVGDHENTKNAYAWRIVDEEEIIKKVYITAVEGNYFGLSFKSVTYTECEVLKELSDDKIIEELIKEYDLKFVKRPIIKGMPIVTNIDENKFGFQNVEYNDYIKNGLDDIWWINYEDATKSKSRVYLKKDGTLAQDEIIKVGDKKYLFDGNNLLVINSTYSIGDKTYLTNGKGIIIDKEGIYRVNNVHDGIFNIDIYNYYDAAYYVNKNGLVEKEKYIEFKNDVYYAGVNGALYENQFNELLYFDYECKLDKVSLYEKNIDFNSENIDLYKKSINNYNKQIGIGMNAKDITDIPNENFLLRINEGIIDVKDIEKHDISNITVTDKYGNLVRHKFVNLGLYVKKVGEKTDYVNFSYYVGDAGKIIYDSIVDINGKKYIFDSDGRQIKNRWLCDSDFYKNYNKKSDTNPYIKGYNVKRELIRDYNGYYVCDYLIDDKVKIEQSYIYHLSRDAEDTTRYECYLVENGKYEYDKDERHNSEWTEDYTIINNYERKQIDEGVYKFVHTKKGRFADATLIDESTIAEQLSRFTINDIDYDSERDETVKFGSWYLYDKTGKEKDRLRWHIIKKDKNMALLITEDIIDCRAFHYKNENVSWQNSDLRQWLNNEFYDEAFTESEKKYIYSVKNEDMRYIAKNYKITKDSIEKIDNIGETIDKVFLLAPGQIFSYLRDKNNKEFLEIENAKFSRYAKEKQKGIDGKLGKLSQNSYWTSRTYEDNNDVNNNAEVIDEYSIINSNSIPVNSSFIGVRPAIWVKFNNRDINEYGSSYNENDDIYYQQLLNDNSIIIDDFKEEYYKDDLNNQIKFCKTANDYNDGEVTEEIDQIVFGKYEIDGASNGKEGIKWIILDKDYENKKALITTKYVIDARMYNDKGGDVTWETSYMRKWLNGEFYKNAFNEYEKELILETLVHTKDETEFNMNEYMEEDESISTKGGNDTKDRIFLLSTDEIEKYLMKSRNLINASATMDLYKKARDNDSRFWYIVYDETYIDRYADRVNYARYLTRSPGVMQSLVKSVEPHYYSEVVYPFMSEYSLSSCGIRPAMWVRYEE